MIIFVKNWFYLVSFRYCPQMWYFKLLIRTKERHLEKNCSLPVHTCTPELQLASPQARHCLCTMCFYLADRGLWWDETVKAKCLPVFFWESDKGSERVIKDQYGSILLKLNLLPFLILVTTVTVRWLSYYLTQRNPALNFKALTRI